jgi:hypothetical protein
VQSVQKLLLSLARALSFGATCTESSVKSKLVQEAVRPGLYLYKVFNRDGHLIYHGFSESVAMSILSKLRELGN